jgi:hypothetical protein
MAKTPWEMAAVGKEFSHQTALMAWAAMARMFGHMVADRPNCYTQAGYARQIHAEIMAGPFKNGLAYQPITQLKWLHAIKNQGHGDRVRGSRSASEGVREGVFDLFLPVPMVLEAYDRPAKFLGFKYCIDSEESRYAGLYIELKTPDRINQKDGGASQAQLDFQADMRAAGYAAEICHGWEAARDCLLTYLGKSPAG